MDSEPKPEEKPAEESTVAEGGTVPPLLEHTPSVETPLIEPERPAPAMEPVPQPAQPASAEPQPSVEETLSIPPEIPREESDQKIKISELLQKANRVRKQRRENNVHKILGLTRKKGHIDNQDVRDLLQVSQSTATNYISELVKSGKLKKEKKARATVYSV